MIYWRILRAWHPLIRFSHYESLIHFIIFWWDQVLRCIFFGIFYVFNVRNNRFWIETMFLDAFVVELSIIELLTFYFWISLSNLKLCQICVTNRIVGLGWVMSHLWKLGSFFAHVCSWSLKLLRLFILGIGW